MRSNSFCKQAINGKLKSCNVDRSGTSFYLVNNEKFWFNPNEKIKGNNSFCHVAKKGDKIIKVAGDSILLLINNNRDTVQFGFYCP